MVNFRPIIIALLLMSLFSIALINGSILLAEQNNSPQSIADNPAIVSYAESLNDTILDYTDDIKDSDEALQASEISDSGIRIVFDFIKVGWKTIKGAPVVMYNLTVGLLSDTLFGSEFVIVFSIVATILTIGIILAVWKLVFTGESG